MAANSPRCWWLTKDFMFPWYLSAASAIIVIGQTVYYRYKLAQLQVQANNAAQLQILVNELDEKVASLEADLKERNDQEHETDVKDAKAITTSAGAIGFLRGSLGGDGAKP